MKAPAKKTTATAVSKAKASAKPAVKAVLKAAVKVIEKSTVKAVAKTAAKAKPVAGVAAKTAPKAVKPVTKPVGKSSPKGVAPAKPASKVAVKAALKPAAAVSKAALPSPTAKTKPAPKKPTAKATPTKTIKPPIKSAAVPAKALQEAPKKAMAAKKTVAPVMAPPPTPVPRPAEKTMLIPAPATLKPGRRSSARALSQMPPPAPMVPTHAPDAAKASYSAIAERVIAPPPHVAAKKDPKLANNWKTKSADTLTDDEVKAMPDAEYMNEIQLAFFRHKLSILKQDIHNSAGETTEHLREDTVVVPDPADRATIEEEHALELRTRDRERKLLKKIEQSIGRIDSGDYGYCDETGEAIGVGRLIARPTANLSLEAQQRRELKQKMFGD